VTDSQNDNNDDDTTPDATNGTGDDALAQAEAIMNDAASSIDGDENSADDALTAATAKAAEHLDDLRRLQAEFVNYRKRVDRDRAALAEQASAKVIEALVPTLDDIAAAREHGDLADGPFASIAAKLEEALSRLGWQAYGATGEVFDPQIHEALMSQPSAEVTEPTVHQVAQPGHRVGDKVVRPARVIVAQPE
jgi:molecular chaperone GrpE